MPGMNSENCINNGEQNLEQQFLVPEQQVREITLTDKLNKKLLESFLQRINEISNPFNDLQQNVGNDVKESEEQNEF